MVNEPLRTGRPRRVPDWAVLETSPGETDAPPSWDQDMANSKPMTAKSSGTDAANAAVQSALRTLEAEGSGIAAISAALQGPLGPAFAAAVDLIRRPRAV